MILVDANLLVYAKMAGAREHAATRDWLDARLGGTPRVGLPWPSLLAFMRLVTNRRIFERPMTLAAAWDQVEEWLRLQHRRRPRAVPRAALGEPAPRLAFTRPVDARTSSSRADPAGAARLWRRASRLG